MMSKRDSKAWAMNCRRMESKLHSFNGGVVNQYDLSEPLLELCGLVVRLQIRRARPYLQGTARVQRHPLMQMQVCAYITINLCSCLVFQSNCALQVKDKLYGVSLTLCSMQNYEVTLKCKGFFHLKCYSRPLWQTSSLLDEWHGLGLFRENRVY